MQSASSQSLRATAAAVAAIAVSLAGVSPAFAEADASDVVQIAADVAPDQGALVAVEAHDDRWTAMVSSATVSIPGDASEAIDIVTADSTEFAIPLPSETSTAAAVALDDGTVVFPSEADDGVTVLVQALATDSVRVQTIVEAPTAPSEFRYAFEGDFAPAIDQEGNVAIIDASDPDRARILAVDDPWAFDAEGQQVDTHYEVRGQTLVQVIEADEHAAYPIVADPRWEWRDAGYGATFSRGETRNIANAASAAASCGVVGYYAKAAGVACFAIAGYVLAQASIAKGNRQCIIIQVIPVPSVWRVGTSHGCFG